METPTNILQAVIILFSYLSFSMAKSISLEFQVKEHSEIGLLVGDLWESYKTRESHLSNPENFHFQMIEENKFISLVSGRLFVKTDIDREQICVKANQCCCFNLIVMFYRLTVQIVYFEIRISIEDINDHAPSWSQTKIFLSVPEHSKLGSKYHLPLAKDPDQAPKNSISKYTLKYLNKSHKKMFSIEYNSVSDNLSMKQLLLKVDANIDREKIDKIELLLIAEDSGTPSLSGSTSLIITITDINDNPPYFDKPPSLIFLKENNQIDQFLCQIVAKDSDISDVGKLSFAFGYSMSNEEKSKFHIDSSTGRILVKQILDYDLDQNTFYLPIQVTDGSNVAETTLVVKLTNENDNAPIISILPHVNNSNNVLFVEENIEDEKTIATLTAEDMDNRSTIISCSCNTMGFKLFRIESEMVAITKYTISLTKPLDREKDEFLQAVITCQDDGYPQQTAKKLLKIRVIDRNDRVPQFPSSITTVYIDEGLPIETFVAKVNATDSDVGLNSQLVYKIDSVHFTIDEYSGILKTNTVFDREKSKEYKIEVTAYDRKNTPDSDQVEKVLSSTTLVRILIKDVNDCAPVFKKIFYEFFIPEGSSSRMYVGSVLAEDADVDEINRQISYAMVIKPYERKNHIAKVYFTVSSDGRIFTTKEVLDREMYEMHSFSVEAWDSGPTNHRVSVDVVIKIEDINDNHPQWAHSSDVGLTLNVTRDEAVGKIITVLKATDSDSGINSTLRFDIIQGNELDVFRLDQNSGSLYLMKQPNSIPEIIRLVIKVSDRGIVPLSNISTVRVYFIQEIAKPFSENRLFEKDLVVMICMITVTLIVSGILVVAIVLLKCKHCYRAPEVKYESKDYRQGHPDGQSSPTASDMFNSAIKLSPDVPLYHNQIYHPNRFIYEAPSGLMSYQSIRKPDNLPLYYTLKPKRSVSEGMTDVSSNYVKTPFSNIYEVQQRHFALAQDFIPMTPAVSPDNMGMHYIKHAKTAPTSLIGGPVLNVTNISKTNPNIESPSRSEPEPKLSATVKWCDMIDDKRVYEQISGPDNTEIHCNHGLMTKDQISSFV